MRSSRPATFHRNTTKIAGMEKIKSKAMTPFVNSTIRKSGSALRGLLCAPAQRCDTSAHSSEKPGRYSLPRMYLPWLIHTSTETTRDHRGGHEDSGVPRLRRMSSGKTWRGRLSQRRQVVPSDANIGVSYAMGTEEVATHITAPFRNPVVVFAAVHTTMEPCLPPKLRRKSGQMLDRQNHAPAKQHVTHAVQSKHPSGGLRKLRAMQGIWVGPRGEEQIVPGVKAPNPTGSPR